MKLNLYLALIPLLVKGGKGTPSAVDASSSELLDQTITAIGGLASLNEIQGLTLQTSLFRSRSLSQSYNLLTPDILIARAATQSISFQFASNSVKQRIDRQETYDDYWRYAHPSLALNFSLVVQTGSNASACFNEGGNVNDPAVPYGFADGYLTDYLVHSAQQTALLEVLKQFDASRSGLVYSVTHDSSSLVNYPTISNPSLNLALLVNNGTWLPYAVRSTEIHEFYGLSTNDIVFSTFTPVSFGQSHKIQYPSRIQTIYNHLYVIEDTVVQNITVNPQFSNDFFTAVPPPAPAGTWGDPYTPHPPHTDSEYPRSEVHEFYESGLWYGPFGQQYNTSSVVWAPVFPGGSVPQISNFYIGAEGAANYVHGLIEFDDGLLITDAAVHRTPIIIQWIKENMPGKKITHVVPSHHHSDHTGGLGALLATGAKLVVPEIAKDYYSNVNGGKFEIETYTADEPFVKKDNNVQFMSVWPENSSPHSSDWVYAVAGPVWSPTYNRSEVVVFNADVINPSSGPAGSLEHWEIAEAVPFFVSAVQQGVPREATLVGAHGHTAFGLGTQDSLANLAGLGGFSYPENPSTTGKWTQR